MLIKITKTLYSTTTRPLPQTFHYFPFLAGTICHSDEKGSGSAETGPNVTKSPPWPPPHASAVCLLYMLSPKVQACLGGGWGGKETQPDLSEIARTLSFLTSGLQEGRISCQVYYSCETHLVTSDTAEAEEHRRCGVSFGKETSPTIYLFSKRKHTNTHTCACTPATSLGEQQSNCIKESMWKQQMQFSPQSLSLQNPKSSRLKHLAVLACRKKSEAVTKQNRCTGIKLLLSNNAPLFAGMLWQVQKFKLQWGSGK